MGIDHGRRRFLSYAAMMIAAASAEANQRAPRELAAIGRGTEWLNSSRLTADSLAGRVVLVNFWTYTCINWLRTLPYIRAWAQKYRNGLLLIGVHTPEFGFEQNLDNVRRAVQQGRIEYPVVIDNDQAIWRAFRNQYWPALYFIDSRGRVRQHHFGEGEYDRSERNIQQLLAEAGAGGDHGGGFVSVAGDGVEAAADWDNLKSAETYVGLDQTRNFASRGGADLDRRRAYQLPSRLALNQWALAGEWTMGGRSAVLNSDNGRIVHRFHARDLHVVMGPSRSASPVRFRVSLDGKPPGAARGVDVDQSGEGTVVEQRLYQLIRQPAPIVDRTFEIEFSIPAWKRSRSRLADARGRSLQSSQESCRRGRRVDNVWMSTRFVNLINATPASLLIFLVVCFLLTASAHAQDNACGPGHLVTIETDGSVSRGSKDRLRRAVADGLPVRVGWQSDANGDRVPDLSHWTDAGFLTEFEGEIFAQIADIQRQAPTRAETRVLMPSGGQRWSGVVGTTGRLEGHFDDASEPQSVRVRSTWCVDARAAACSVQWRMVYRHDSGGAPLDGSKQALIDAIRRGAALRLAWGFSSAEPSGRDFTFEHTAEPVFVSILNGDHVFVQLPEHIGQTSYTRRKDVRFDRASVMWRGLMGSDGTFDAVWVDRATGEEVRRLPQRAAVAWFAELPGVECSAVPPLTLAIPGGVQRK